MRLGAAFFAFQPVLAACVAAQEPEAVDPVASSDATGALLVANKRGNTLSKIDLASAKVVRKIAVSSPKEAMQRQQVTILWSGDGKRIYVAETASDTVAEVDFASGKVLRRLPTGEGGDRLAVIP